MRKLLRWQSLGALLAAVLFSLACSDASPTDPETAIPSFGVQQIGACAEWSCAIADCRNDPAIYGACCVAVADPGEPSQPKPSCEAPPVYCQIFPDRCTSGGPCNSANVDPGCYTDPISADAPDLCYDVCE